MKSLHHIILTGIFMLLLSAPVLNDCFHIIDFERPDENRKYCDSLKLSFSRLDAFPDDAENYLADNFSFRSPLIHIYSRIKFRVYNVSPMPDQLIVGSDGRFFLAGDHQEIFEGSRNFNSEELSKMENTWIKRKRYFDSLGIAVYLMPSPTALEIYPEALPSKIKKRFPFNRFDQIEKKFAKNLPGLFINNVAALKAAKKKGNVYARLDNHWTYIGGHAASQLLLEAMKRDHFHDLDISFMNQYTFVKEKRGFGIFVRMLDADDLVEYAPVQRGPDQAERVENYDLEFNRKGVDPNEQQYRFLHTDASRKLKLLVIRDSFGECLYPFLKEAFGESLFIFDSWEYGMNKSIVEKFRPDVVVFETYDPDLWKYVSPAE